MLYNIPVTHLNKLEKQIQRIKNKGADIIFNVGPEIYVEDHEIPGVFHQCAEVEVEGEYKINGWEFAATIEHGENGNIIRAINNDLGRRVPERYRTCGRECEHCRRVRDRKDTYLIYNQQKNDWKQVGRTCLMDYTHGLDAETCAQIASFIDSCNKGPGKADMEEFLAFKGHSNDFVSAKMVKKIAYGWVKEHGYQKNGVTTSQITGIIYHGEENDTNEASDQEIAEVNAWVSELPDSNNYFWNAKTAWGKEYLEARDIGLVSSLISVFFKERNAQARREAEIQKTKQDANNVTVGQVGDRIEITVKSARVLYTKDNSHASYYAPDSYVWEIVDEEGHTFIWSASTSEIKPGDKITATVKSFKEFRGRQQTVITRGKISRSESLKESHESNKFELGTAGFIKEDGSFLYADEEEDWFHGGFDTDTENAGYPEFSNTHCEEDTCVRLYKEPNEVQYTKLEEIIDTYLDSEQYCKVEIWNGKHPDFYKTYSLIEGACEDPSQEEQVGNWTGYKLIRIIKNYFNNR